MPCSTISPKTLDSNSRCDENHCLDNPCLENQGLANDCPENQGPENPHRCSPDASQPRVKPTTWISVSTHSKQRHQQLYFDPDKDHFWLRLQVELLNSKRCYVFKRLSHDAAFALAGIRNDFDI